MEVNNRTPGGKENFTTPGGPFRPPADGSGRRYSFGRSEDRPETKRQGPAAPQKPGQEAPGPRPAAAPASPFAPTPQTVRPAAFRTENPEQPAGPDRETKTGTDAEAPEQAAGRAPVYTIRLPASAKQRPEPKRSSLWWVPLVLLAALLAGILLGALLYSALQGTGVPVRPAESAVLELTDQQIYRENLSAVVSVTAVKSTSSGKSSAGSGFLISDDGYLLTSGHVAEGADSLLVSFSSGQSYPARLVALERASSDLALLKIEARGLRAAALGDSDSLEVGDRVCTIGNPTGKLEFSLSTGIVSAELRELQTDTGRMTMLQTNAAFNKGNSGGPLFDGTGRVVGVVTAKIGSSDTETLEGLGFALPINGVMALVRPWLDADRNS